MFKGLFTTSLLILGMMIPGPALSTVVFDFDEVARTSGKTPGGLQVELYMEGLYGSDVTVSQKTTAVYGAPIYGYGSADSDNAYLKLGKGKGPLAIVLHFEDDPIDSFSVDFKLLKKAKKFAIFADGELISLDTLSKAQKKTGLSGQKTFFFDTPVHTLEFVGKKNSFLIDNLVVDLSAEETVPETHNNENHVTAQLIPLNDTGPVTQNQVTVAEPSSLLLLALGIAAALWRSSRSKRA